VADQAWSVLASLAAGLALGGLGRTLLRSRVRLSWSDAVVAGLVGAAAGSVVAGVSGSPGRSLPLLAVAVALGGTMAALLVMERRQARRRLPRGATADLIAGGESGRVEFKSSARYNRHTGMRDERMELAVSKSVAGFLNAEGGVLLIGVADDGSVTGIEDDYGLNKHPGRDSFELWLRDQLVKTLGTVAAGTIRVVFSTVDGYDVCRVTAPPSTRPVFLRAGVGQPAALHLRVGNSTRELDVAEALTYCTARWGSGRRLRGD